MGLFSTKQSANQSGNRAPSERGPLNEVCVGELWVSKDGRKNFSVSRINPKDSAKPFKTFRPQDMGHYLEAIGLFCSAFSHDPALTRELQAELGQLSAEIESVVARAKRGFVQKENGAMENEGFFAAAA